MAGWTRDELAAIGDAEELKLGSERLDGSFRRPVTMWVVGDGDDLYVRSVNGRESGWFRGVQDRHAARISAGGVDRDVDLVETDDAGDDIDTAYRTKYSGRYASIVPSIVAPEARAATLRLVPR
jgi:hypothetical protein